MRAFKLAAHWLKQAPTSAAELGAETTRREAMMVRQYMFVFVIIVY
jgi:hypothetical protein